MKKKILLLLSLAMMAGCEKNEIGVSGQANNTFSTEPVLNKRGVCITTSSPRWSHRISELGAHWTYSWGPTLRDEVPENVEFVPMFWGAGSVNANNISYIQGLINEGKVKYVLGFNEPDGVEQANMTVDQALALWPQLEALGVPLVSPATVSPTNAWMKEFMQRADEMGLRIDYIGVHHYGGPNHLSFIGKLKETYELYGKRPIWITEFAVADWTATTPSANRFTQEQVNNFMTESLKALDEIDWIFRYSWFDGRQAPLVTSALYEEDRTTLTPVGLNYANTNRNLIIGPGQDTEFEVLPEEGELILNGGFESGTSAPWGGFKNDAVGPATTAPYEGGFCGRIQNGDGSLLHIVDVEPGEEYTLKFWSKWQQEVTNSFTAAIRNNNGNTLLFPLPNPMPMTTEWTETVFTFTVPADVTQLRLSFYKGQGFPPFFMDNVSLRLAE